MDDAGEGPGKVEARAARGKPILSSSPIEIALESEFSAGADDGPARTLLINQNRLVGWQIASERAGVALKALLGLGGAVVALALAVMVWRAAHANGVVIDAFSVPPDFAAKGLTGQVVAGQLQDRLVQLQAQTNSARAAASYANDWGRDIKVQIPETGVSIGELQRYLREWLGHETHVGGEIYRTPTGLAMTVRADGEAGDPVAGTEAELDKLLSDGAMALYKKTQPYRWVAYEAKFGDYEKARPLAEQLAASGDSVERGWAYNHLRAEAETAEQAIAYAREGLQVAPRTTILWDNVAGIENGLGRWEAARSDGLQAVALFKSRDHGGYDPVIAQRRLHSQNAQLASWLGDFTVALAENEYALQVPIAAVRLSARRSRARLLAYRHEPGQALRELRAPQDDAAILSEFFDPTQDTPVTLPLSRFVIERERGDWTEAYRQAAAAQAVIEKTPENLRHRGRFLELIPTQIWPALAEAAAEVGRRDEAQALAATTPTDCYPCLRARAKIAALAGDPREADRWFAEAVRQAPHFPSAQTEWGQVLLARGQPDLAIAQFQAANKIGPRFADPLEGWGEALMAKGDFKAAAGKFEQANRYAPNWGRLHLKWGQVLAKMGEADEARAQFAAAARMDLTAAEKAELERVGR